ncbi:hypothetical protein NWO25_08720 [Enterococcus lactis]|nr:hypothetical protein [Enterococcus lactis]
MPEINFLNARDQLVSPSVATVYTPFPLRIRDRFGQLPEIVFDHPGTYDGENVIWHEAGTNNLHWYTTGGASIEFSGTVIQQAIPDYRPSQPGRIRYTFNPRSTTVTWEPSVDHYGISHYEFYLWDFLIATTTEPEFIAEDIRHHGQYPITIMPFLTAGENQILLSILYIDHGCQSTKIKKNLRLVFVVSSFYLVS